MTTRITKPGSLGSDRPATVAELDAILNAPEPLVTVMPDGSTRPEPFVIKANDKLAPAAIRMWISEAYLEGVSQEKINKAVTHYNAVVAWQIANPDKVKVPD